MCASVSSSSSSSISILITTKSCVLKKSQNSNPKKNRHNIFFTKNVGITDCLKSNHSENSNPSKFGGKPSSIPSYKELGFKDIGTETEHKYDKECDFAESEVRLDGLNDERELKKRSENDDDELGLKLEEPNQRNRGQISERKRGWQLMKRSNLLAKQVISIQSALGLGFITQLWVDTLSWVVLVIEVRPSLLSGELERFFLEDVRQVGDVVLIQDEGVMENDLQVAGLETLVGYDVITPGQQTIGKVRGYNFNINSGAVESLELDPFGISFIPSSLVSSYALLVEDVLEVISDTVVVHEAAVLRIQRLTKGFWGSQKLGRSIDELEDYPDLEKPPIRPNKGRSRRRTSSSQKFVPRKGADLDDWELPKDYL